MSYMKLETDLSMKCPSQSITSLESTDNAGLRLIYVEGRLRVLEAIAIQRWINLGIAVERTLVEQEPPIVEPKWKCGCGRGFFKKQGISAHRRWSENIKCYAGEVLSDKLDSQRVRGDLGRRSRAVLARHLDNNGGRGVGAVGGVISGLGSHADKALGDGLLGAGPVAPHLGLEQPISVVGDGGDVV